MKNNWSHEIFLVIRIYLWLLYKKHFLKRTEHVCTGFHWQRLKDIKETFHFNWVVVITKLFHMILMQRNLLVNQVRPWQPNSMKQDPVSKIRAISTWISSSTIRSSRPICLWDSTIFVQFTNLLDGSNQTSSWSFLMFKANVSNDQLPSFKQIVTLSSKITLGSS